MAAQSAGARPPECFGPRPGPPWRKSPSRL
ncbi:hypothetical protein EYF80_065881 [Liparis tanakae]|uniref:Uncharacterized protein n=1 Tax=Liparis tanakae TaxID=230148 RepID=A0A4Z2E4Z7_9TELE|nr:hypothetical protein EYF80_065881 [Liparis tanakae]